MIQEWREILSRRNRTSKTKCLFVGGQPTNNFSTDIAIGSVHYKDALDEWQEIDPSLVPSIEPGWDWEMRKSHWRLLIKNGGWIGIERGGVGFGFKLLGWTFLNVATKEYEAIRNATYSAPIISGNELTWEWIYPGVDYKLAIGPDGMGYSINISQAVRDGLPPSPYPAADTFFVFVYQVVWDDCPHVGDMESETCWEDRAQSFEPNQGLWLVDAVGKVRAWLPLGWVLAVEGAGPIEMRHRYVKRDAAHYLLSGAKWDALKGLPAGEIVLSSNIGCGIFYPQEV